MCRPSTWRPMGVLRREATIVSFSFVCALGLTGCEIAPRTSDPRPASRVSTRKPDCYTDAALLPDRRSERRREEGALAAELEALIGLLPDVRHVRATVSLAAPPHVVVVVQQRASGAGSPTSSREHTPAGDVDASSAGASSIETMIRTIAHGVVPSGETTVLTTIDAALPASIVDAANSSAEERPPRSAVIVALWLALGMVFGALVERIRVRVDGRRAGR